MSKLFSMNSLRYEGASSLTMEVHCAHSARPCSSLPVPMASSMRRVSSISSRSSWSSSNRRPWDVNHSPTFMEVVPAGAAKSLTIREAMVPDR